MFCFSERADDQNESIQLEGSQVVEILKNEKPEESKVIVETSKFRVELKFVVILKGKTRAVKFFFEAVKDSVEVPGQFLIALMKLSIENGMMINTMRKVVEAKDKEIEEYKLNGATLIRRKNFLRF